MNKTVLKLTALFFICFFAVAAMHEVAPGLCTAQGPNRIDTCPFCKLVYTLVIAGTVFVLANPWLLRFIKRFFDTEPPSLERIVSFQLRAPPAVSF